MEHGTFPFPSCDENRSIVGHGGGGHGTDISQMEVGLLEEWKAGCAVRDNTLVQKLCRTLENILGDISLAVEDDDSLSSIQMKLK